jgi:hypothetical protein
MLESADTRPTTAMQTAYTDYCHDLTKLVAGWNVLMTSDFDQLNAELQKQHTEKLSDPPDVQTPACQ